MNRLDKELSLRGLAKSRSYAEELIKNSAVAVNDKLCEKPSLMVSEHDKIEIIGEVLKYASRGGLKLERALNAFDIDLKGLTCLDIGAGTGGFTDCMLQNGAKLVYAVDVGQSQLNPLIKNNERVIALEQTDIRSANIPIAREIDFLSVDVSFISLKLIIPELSRFLKPNSRAVLLIKPQFETGKRHKGVIADEKLQEKIAEDIKCFAVNSGFEARGLIDSPILGGSGNREFLLSLIYLEKQ